jgi:tRNA pseudouridine55 synthase
MGVARSVKSNMTSDADGFARCGLVVVDKPPGFTSHDVVSWARRVFSTREVGHAGTLDPMATGVLVLLIGEGTKLSSWVTSEDKRYEAELRFGIATDTLDAEGVVTARFEGAPPTRDAIEREIAAMVGTLQQVPPEVSAIKVRGVAAHERVRRGESVELSAREVVLRAASLALVEDDRARVTLEVSKGFYVRSFARDLAARLGTVAHLSRLRRVRSGVFDVAGAVDGEALRQTWQCLRDASSSSQHALRARWFEALRPLRVLEGAMPSTRVDRARGVALMQGRAVSAPEDAPEGVSLVFVDRSASGLPPQPIGLAERRGPTLVARRNFRPGRVLEAWEPWIDGDERDA